VSRPANPSYTTRAFAPDANYPSTPGKVWSLQPTKVEPPGAGTVGFTPETGDAAEHRNKLFYDAFVQDVNAKTKLDELYTYLGQLQALNFPIASVDLSNGGSDILRGAFYNAPLSVWFVQGDAGIVRASDNQGYTWSATSIIAAVSDETERCFNGACDASGNTVVTTDSRYIFEMTASTTVWTKVDAAGTAMSSAISQVVFDPIRSLFCYVSGDSSNVTKIFTSSNRTSWTSRTVPTSFNAALAHWRLEVKPSSGRIVMTAYRSSDSKLLIATSDDGGVTWTERTFLTTTIVPTLGGVSLTYNSTRNEWLYIIGEQSGTPSCEVWKSSDDGVTWTKILTLTNACLCKPAPVGTMWVGGNRSNGVAYSLDGGVSWYTTARALALNEAYYGGGTVMLQTNSTMWPSLRAGPGFSVLT
jgi:hypothetical protein